MPFGRSSVDPGIGSVRIVFAGDVNLDGHPGQVIAAGGDPFSEVSALLADADLSVANLECVVANSGSRYPKKFTFRAHPRVLPVLARHFGAVSLANNHSGDFGHDAFREQLGLLKRQKLPYFGGGVNIREARAPLVVERNGLHIALLGYDDYYPREFEAGMDSPGVAWAVEEQMVEDVRAARTRHHADLVIAYLHWGWEEYPACDRQKELAHLLIDEGADLVVGAHPHVTQEVEFYRGKLIAYSLGNFLFEGFRKEETQVGWLLRCTMNRTGLIRWDTVAIRMNEQGIPRRAPDVASPYGEGKGVASGATSVRR
jgi:poly-gamma-glutamate synthesis protein (capsule biosynthesis protein)